MRLERRGNPSFMGVKVDCIVTDEQLGYMETGILVIMGDKED